MDFDSLLTQFKFVAGMDVVDRLDSRSNLRLQGWKRSRPAGLDMPRRALEALAMNLRERIASLMRQVRPELAELVAIRSVADPRQFPPEECARAARWVADAFARTSGMPVLAAQVLGLVALALAFLLAMTRLSLRRRTKRRGPGT